MSELRGPSCQDEVLPDLIPVAQAREKMLQALNPVTRTQVLPIDAALGYILAEDVVALADIPPHANAAMDGYAIRAADLPAAGTLNSLKVVGQAFAGHPFSGCVQPGQCVQVMTGAKLPDGADTVVINEHSQREGDQLRIGDDTQAARNVRPAGEDLAVGECAIEAGTELTPAHIGLLASLGQAQCCVWQRPRVAIFSTGDELVPVGTPLQAGQIYDSNRHCLIAMLRRMGIEAIDLGRVADDAQKTEQAMKTATEQADLIISTGGASAGDADFVSQRLRAIADVSFWRLAMRPGRPLAFGHIDQSAYFGLPGNPVAVLVTFYEFVAPALRQMMGARRLEPPTFRVQAGCALRKLPGRVEYQRGILRRDEAGVLRVFSTGKQGAGKLSSVSNADCLMILPSACASISVDDWVDVHPFHGLV